MTPKLIEKVNHLFTMQESRSLHQRVQGRIVQGTAKERYEHADSS